MFCQFLFVGEEKSHVKHLNFWGCVCAAFVWTFNTSLFAIKLHFHILCLLSQFVYHLRVCLRFWHERRRCSRSPFRPLTGNDVSGPLFSSLFFSFHFSFFFSSPSRTFLIDRLFGWKSVFSESCSERAKT